MKRIAFLLLAAGLAPLAASDLAHATTPAPTLDGTSDGSLEELIREVRRRREASAKKLTAPVEALVKDLDNVPLDEPDEAARVQQALIALGVEAAPLLVPRLDPGAAAGGPERRLSQRLVVVLTAMPTRAVTDDLIKMAREGSKNGRLNAISVLGTSPDRARASATLVDLYKHSVGEFRERALRSIATLGGPENEAVLVAALRETDTGILKAVLAALTDVGSPAGLPAVRDLAGAPNAAAPIVGDILGYYRSLPEDAIEDEDAAALLRLAAHDAPSKSDRLATLEAISELVSSLDSRTKRLFDPLLGEADDELREGAQICLALLGDRNARKDVIKQYNDLVSRNDTWAGAYEQRAAVLLRLEEFDSAVKDFRRAIKIYTDQGRTSNLDKLYVELARCFALDGNAKKAFDALEEGRLPRSLMRKVKVDPDFRVVLEHSRYGKIFDV